VVQEKEADRAYSVLHKREDGPEQAIPDNDRSDFLKAYERGDRNEALKVLDRESFRKNMFRSAEAKPIEHYRVEVDRPENRESLAREIVGTGSEKLRENAAAFGDKADLEVSEINLEGLKLAEASGNVSSANVPAGDIAPASRGSSFRGA
jgi:hypothetical protein